MKSPFPGMDPYLEQHWQDVHHRLCTYACDVMQERLGGGGGELVARLGERLVVESLLDQPRTIYPDVRVVEYSGGARQSIPEEDSGGGVATAVLQEATATEPIIIELANEPEPQGYIEIIETRSGRLVTVVEFLSPSNKLAGDGSRQYRRKQREVYAAGVSLVEIDLVRAGPRAFLLPEVQFPQRVSAPYYACVHRGWKLNRFELYPISLRQRLPAIRVPLREQDRDIVLDLQPLIEKAYQNGAYGRTDYRQACLPPLEGEDGAWVEEMLRGAGKR